MTTAPDHIDDTPSPTDLQQFVHLASNLFELLQTAKRELEHDREATKALLVTASSIPQSVIERRSRTKGVRPRRISRLADSARALSSTRICTALSTPRTSAPQRSEAHHISRGPSNKPSENHRTLAW